MSNQPYFMGFYRLPRLLKRAALRAMAEGGGGHMD